MNDPPSQDSLYIVLSIVFPRIDTLIARFLQTAKEVEYVQVFVLYHNLINWAGDFDVCDS